LQQQLLALEAAEENGSSSSIRADHVPPTTTTKWGNACRWGEEDSLLPFAGSMGTWEQDTIGTREHPHVPPLLLFPFLERFSNYKFNFSEFQQSMNKYAK
jgi:hypothetical protein